MPLSGIWQISYSFTSTVWPVESESNGGLYGGRNEAYIDINDRHKMETINVQYSDASSTVTSTGSRGITVEASAGDSIKITTSYVTGELISIVFCIDFISTM